VLISFSFFHPTFEFTGLRGFSRRSCGMMNHAAAALTSITYLLPCLLAIQAIAHNLMSLPIVSKGALELRPLFPNSRQFYLCGLGA
jgi:hypothetical protein